MDKAVMSVLLNESRPLHKENAVTTASQNEWQLPDQPDEGNAATLSSPSQPLHKNITRIASSLLAMTAVSSHLHAPAQHISKPFGTIGAKPHVLFTVVDDWGYELWPRYPGRLRAMLPSLTHTFVQHGMALSRHYSFHCCAPSRQSLMSGRLPIHFNEINSVCSGIPREMSTLGDKMREAGYATHFIGKWHCGFNDPSATPSRRGFDSAMGFYMKAHHHFTHCSWVGHNAHSLDVVLHNECRAAPSAPNRTLYDLFEGTSATGKERALGAEHWAAANQTYSTTLFALVAKSRLMHHPLSKPLFLFLAFSAVHLPYLAPKELWHRQMNIPHTPRYFKQCEWAQPFHSPCATRHIHNRKAYEAMAIGVDDAIGALTSVLQARGMWNDTLIVFASDNGGPVGIQASNSPLRGGKDTFFEGGVRSLASLGGGWLPPVLHGKDSPAVMHLADWFATLSVAAGVKPIDNATGVPPVDGQNIWPAWLALEAAHGSKWGRSGRRSAKREASLIGGNRSLALGSFALLSVNCGIASPRPAGVATSLWQQRGTMLCSVFKLVQGTPCQLPKARVGCLPCNESGCLFEVIEDESESHDLSQSRPLLLAKLREELARLRTNSWRDPNPLNKECWEVPKGDPNLYLEYALKHNAVMQPWLTRHRAFKLARAHNVRKTRRRTNG
mmetsp:Transcript_30455/g.50442  ORF Transcript_30455/g.50442 Transcript_30455/m.50442 type:complete len:670 (-) Transcript_30455:78-2087(-)|eukprot:CAMPEP_0119329944 /NCGR_PEP_ID=MMETSP1333-20130426/77102_1 /TAXON_ID=418940 /ORGANISM="Scyphosphaera apsteinii, Strain RCC1455" /LENGTH=669 /DNA_ID=CAMNT_0007339197 /DNA_START=151 /DNA_END=2160 /DNA_ORIENTATION=+